MEKDGDREKKNGRILFDRPKPTVGCGANGGGGGGGGGRIIMIKGDKHKDRKSNSIFNIKRNRSFLDLNPKCS